MQTAVAAIFDDVVNNQPVGPQNQGIDNRRIRYIFNPFETIPLTSPYNRLFGMGQISAGVILPVRIFSMQDQDASVVARAHLLSESESSVQTPQATFLRLPGVVVPAMLREFEESYQIKTGFCEIQPLVGFEDIANVRQMNETFFGKMFLKLDDRGNITRGKDNKPATIYRTALERIGFLENVIKPEIDDRVWFDSLTAVITSYQLSLEWAKMHYQRIVTALDAFSNNQPNGKSQVSKFDERICAYIGAKVPRLQSNLVQQPEQQVVKVEIAQPTTPQAAPQPEHQGETGECPNCWRIIPYKNGRPAPLCFHCGIPTNELVSAKVEPVAATEKTATKPAAANANKPAAASGTKNGNK